MKIESVLEENVAEIKKLARKAILESVSAEASLKEGIISDTERHIDQNIGRKKCVFLKCSSNEILGFILIQDYWNLSDLYIDPEAQGQGIGKSLFNTAKTLCESNRDRDYIRVNSSINAEGFYRNVGFDSFTPEKEIPSYIVPLIYNFQCAQP